MINERLVYLVFSHHSGAVIHDIHYHFTDSLQSQLSPETKSSSSDKSYSSSSSSNTLSPQLHAAL